MSPSQLAKKAKKKKNLSFVELNKQYLKKKRGGKNILKGKSMLFLDEIKLIVHR
jgi:hypothetical protein